MIGSLKDVLLHLVSEAIFAGLFILLEYCRYLKQIKRHFDKAHFNIYKKGHNKEIIREAYCTVKWDWGHSTPKISYKGTELGNRGFEGAFYISPINLKIGSGVHFHNDYDGFNFPKILIKDKKTFYVESEYITATENVDNFFELKPQAWVWRKEEEG